MPETSEPVFIDAQGVAASIELTDVIAALRRAYAALPADSRATGRAVVRGGDGTRTRALAAILPDGSLLGTKTHVQPASGGSRFLVSLFSQASGDLVALLDGRAITELRTGATSALALDLLAPPGPFELALLGSGSEARSHLRAIAVLRELRRVRVFSPTPARRERFASEMAAELGVEIVACSTAEDALSGAATIVAAARSHGELPLFGPDAVTGAATIVSIGSTVPEQRELDERVLDRAALIIADEPREVLEQSGDCIAAARAGIELAARTHPLAQLVQEALGIAIDHGAVNVFKSVGSALQDVAVAQAVLDSALNAGRAVALPVRLSPKERHG